MGRFDRDRSITFIPPDGVFELMTYRINENVNLPFKITPVVQEIGNQRIEFSIKIRAVFDRTNFATNVVVKVPVPKNTAQTKIFGVGTGRAKYEPDTSCIAWRIKRFPGDAEYVMTGEASLTQTKSEKQWGRPPISLDF